MKLLILLGLVSACLAFHLNDDGFDAFDTKFDQLKNEVDKKLADIEAKKPGISKEVHDAVNRNDAAKKEQLKGPIGEIFEVMHNFDNILREEQQNDKRTSTEKMWISSALGKIHKLWREFTVLRQMLNPKKPDEEDKPKDRFQEWAKAMGKRIDAAQTQVRTAWKDAQNAVTNRDKTAKKRILTKDVSDGMKVLNGIRDDINKEKQGYSHSSSESAQISVLEQRNAVYFDEYGRILNYLNSKENFPEY